MKTLYIIALILLVVWGVNWWLVGLANFDLVAFVLGAGTVLAKLVYTLVGISAVYIAVAKVSGCSCQDSRETKK